MVSSLARDIWKLNAARSVEELTGHYRRLCKLYHPDLRSPDQRAQSERHMQAVNEAYSQALERFNILTYRNPRLNNGRGAMFHEELFDPPAPAAPQPRTPEEPGPVRTTTAQEARRSGANAYAMGEAARALGRALALLSDARTFNSFKSARSEEERQVYRKALPLLHDVARRFPSLREGRDALFYAAVCECNLRCFEFALHTFGQYRERYRGCQRETLLYFYCGICRHRLGQFASATAEYARFLKTQPSGMFKHFLTLVEVFRQAALREETPPDLPYA